MEKAAYLKGAQVFLPCSQKIWALGEIKDVGESHVTVLRYEDNKSVKLSKKETIYLANAENLPNSTVQVPSDLTQLKHLHEASVLESLYTRYGKDFIYTFTGPILIAINPYKMIEKLYDARKIREYLVASTEKDPHLFAVANTAYLGICMRQKSQSILISGESGSGKTESTKFVLKFLAVAGSEGETKQSEIENQVIESNPLLEAFGNAKTLRNNNSSRFGKFIELQFKGSRNSSTDKRLYGARVQTYLLEKVRVCHQQEGERNFHIFYQLCAAAEQSVDNSGIYEFPQTVVKKNVNVLKQKMDFSMFDALVKYKYLTKSSCRNLSDVDELEEFENTIYAMQTIGMGVEEQMMIFTVAMAVLCIGNISFVAPKDNTEVSLIAPHEEQWLQRAADFLDTPVDTLAIALTERLIRTMNENISKPLPLEEAKETRDALARSLYGALFLKIVSRVNETIGYHEDIELFCGVLDIFGFECFKFNSFEQMCINFTNERLQFFFNNFVFKYEEALYQYEEIPWSHLDFPDNQDCVELFQEKLVGIFAMLDEECIVPSGSDRAFNLKLCRRYDNHKRFQGIKTKPNFFVVNHFAGSVTYCSDGFLDKNKDLLSEDAVQAVKESNNSFVLDLFSNFLRRGLGEKLGTTRRSRGLVTVSNAFCEQLNDLLDRVDVTEPHFIRCIKPNNMAAPNFYDRWSVNEQLKYGGVLEAVKVSRAGYPVRMLHTEFLYDYDLLADSKRVSLDKVNGTQLKDYAEIVIAKVAQKYQLPLTQLGLPSWAIGKTKCFFKAEAFDILSSVLSVKRTNAAIFIQARVKGMLQYRQYHIQRICAIAIQRAFRVYLAEKEARRRKEYAAATLINAATRGYLARCHFKAVLKQLIMIQRAWRDLVVREQTKRYRIYLSTSKIQATWKMFKERCDYLQLRKAVVRVQLRWKQILAMRLFRKLKADSRAVGTLLAKVQQLDESLSLANLHKIETEYQNMQLSSKCKSLLSDNQALNAEVDELKIREKALLEQVAHLKVAYSNHVQAADMQRIEIQQLQRDLAVGKKSLADQKHLLAKNKEQLKQLKENLYLETTARRSSEESAMDLQAKIEALQKEKIMLSELLESHTEKSMRSTTANENHVESLGFFEKQVEYKKKLKRQTISGLSHIVITFLGGEGCNVQELIGNFLKNRDPVACEFFYNSMDLKEKKCAEANFSFKNYNFKLYVSSSVEQLFTASEDALYADFLCIVFDSSDRSTLETAIKLLKQVKLWRATYGLYVMQNDRLVHQGKVKSEINVKSIMDEIEDGTSSFRYVIVTQFEIFLSQILDDPRCLQAIMTDYNRIAGNNTHKEAGNGDSMSNGKSSSEWTRHLNWKVLMEKFSKFVLGKSTASPTASELLKPSFIIPARFDKDKTALGMRVAARVDAKVPISCAAIGRTADNITFIGTGGVDGSIFLYYIIGKKPLKASADLNSYQPRDKPLKLPNKSEKIFLHHNWKAHNDVVTALFFSKDAESLFSASADNTIKHWSVASGDPKALFNDTKPVRFCVPFREIGNFVSILQENTIKFVDPTNGAITLKMQLKENISAVAFNTEDTLLFIGFENGTILPYAMSSKSRKKLQEIACKSAAINVEKSVLSLSCCFCDTSKKEYLVIATLSRIFVYEIGLNVAAADVHLENVASMSLDFYITSHKCISTIGGLWITCGSDSGVIVVMRMEDADKMENRKIIVNSYHLEEEDEVRDILFDSNRNFMVSCHVSGALIVWRNGSYSFLPS